MPAVYEHRHIVVDEDLDELDHVGNLEYLRWTQAAAIAHSTAQGWSTARYFEEDAGWVVRSHSITYLRPAHAGDEILIRTWVSDFRKARSLRKYRIERCLDGELLAVAETDWAFVCFSKRTPLRIPPHVAEAFVVVPPDDAPS